MSRLLKPLLAGSLLWSMSLYAMSDQEAMGIAKEAIQTVGGTLKHTLGKKIKENGFGGAAKFCSTKAGSVAKEASKKLPKGVSVKRITDKPRNIKNLASKKELVVLEELKAKKAAGNMPKMLVKKLQENHYQVYKPLVIGDKCLNCHGTEQKRNKDAYKVISKKFPNDKAIGYKKGDFRGAFVVDIIK